METLFDLNAKRWALFCPEDAQQLISFAASHQLAENKKNHDLNVNDPEAEAREWFATLNLSNISVIYVYGIGAGQYFKAAEEWLKEENHFLVFLEDDQEVIYRLFQTELGTLILNHPQVRLSYFLNVDPLQKVWMGLGETFGCKEFVLSSLSSYKEKRESTILEIHAAISFWSNLSRVVRSEYFTFGQHFFSNFYRNVQLLPEAFLATELFGKFTGVPAIICGAGPSLKHNLSLLETLSNRALIFAGGSSMNAINSNGFVPHLGLGIDPNPTQLTRLIANTAYEVPFLYRNRLNNEALNIVQGDRLFVAGSGGYRISDWMEKELGTSGEHVSEGFNVVNFSLALAYAFGCNPIIFVGLDLAYSDDQSYHSGVKSHPIHSRKRDFRTKTVQEELLIKEDIFGRPVHTVWKWVSESLWFGQFSQEHTDALFINATEGGIGLPGIPNKPLNEVADFLMVRRFDLDVRLHGEIQNATMPSSVTLDKIRTLIFEVDASLERCHKYSLRFINEAKGIVEALEKGEEAPATDTTEQVWKDLIEELAYQHILKDFDENFQPTIGLNIQAYELFLDTPEANLRKERQRLERWQFLANTILMNRTLIQLYVRQKSPEEMLPIATQQTVSSSPEEIYTFEHDTVTIIDPEMQLNIRKTVPIEALATELLHYPNGQVKLAQSLENHLLHGPTTFYSEEGRILAQSWYVQGLQQGKAKYYFSTGEIHSIRQYREGLKEGAQHYYYRTGQLKTKMSYAQGNLEGEVLLYYPNGTLKREIHFHQGKLHGVEKMWNERGIQIIEAEFTLGESTGIARTWHQNGQLAQEMEYDATHKVKTFKSWTAEGVLIPESKSLQEDYFDAVAKQTALLTDSLENVFNGLDKIAPLLFPQQKDIQEGLKKDLGTLRAEIKHMEAMHNELLEYSGVKGDDSLEPIWKSPTARRELQAQLEEMTKKLTREIGTIQNIVSLAVEKHRKGREKKDEGAAN
ncbi:MAG: motility associated factor glycosyltransferase family protein [Parachlamydiaceae bacterium]|nr:motility associated factor glycosyltransferase family protein [Parachlamydiaceae bacterium]